MPEKYKSPGIDFSYYTRQMLQDMDPKLHHSIQPALFSKKPLLQISKLKKFVDNSSEHISKDKLSEKLGRRDIQFYDLYKLNSKDEDVTKLIQSEYPSKGVLACGANKVNEENKDEAEEDAIYGDIEIDDFNHLFKNPNLINDCYGQSISITVNYNKANGKMDREVKEDLTKVVMAKDTPQRDAEGDKQFSQGVGQSSATSNDRQDCKEENKLMLKILNEQL